MGHRRADRHPLARALPQLLAAPGAWIEARVHHDGRTASYTLVAADHPWLHRLRPRRRSLDSRMEEDPGAGPSGEDRSRAGRLGEGARLLEEDGAGAVVWFTDRPSARPVLDAVERVARGP